MVGEAVDERDVVDDDVGEDVVQLIRVLGEELESFEGCGDMLRAVAGCDETF